MLTLTQTNCKSGIKPKPEKKSANQKIKKHKPENQKMQTRKSKNANQKIKKHKPENQKTQTRNQISIN